MTVNWHCRSCNATGEREMAWKDIMLKYSSLKDTHKHVLEVIQDLCKHECENPDVGIMVDDSKKR